MISNASNLSMCACPLPTVPRRSCVETQGVDPNASPSQGRTTKLHRNRVYDALIEIKCRAKHQWEANDCRSRRILQPVGGDVG